MLHFPTPAHYQAEPPVDVLLETISRTDNSVIEAVELPASEIADLQSVQRRTRRKWRSLPLNDRVSGVAVRAVTSAGEALYAYTLTDFACQLYRVERPTWPVHIDAAKIFLQIVG